MEIRRFEGWGFGDARGGDFALRKAGIRRFERWEFDEARGVNLAILGALEPCKE